MNLGLLLDGKDNYLYNMNLQEQISRIQEMMGMDDSRLTFDIQKLVDDGINVG